MGNRRQRSRAEGTFLETVAARLQHVEQLILELHWYTVGPCHGLHYGGWVSDSTTATHQKQPEAGYDGTFPIHRKQPEADYDGTFPNHQKQPEADYDGTFSIHLKQPEAGYDSTFSIHPKQPEAGYDITFPIHEKQLEAGYDGSTVSHDGTTQGSFPSQTCYQHWKPSLKRQFTNPGSAMDQELNNEAASVLQRHFRRYLQPGSCSDSAADGDQDDDDAGYRSPAPGDSENSDADHHRDDNSPETVAIRCAFITSIQSIAPSVPLSDIPEPWNQAEILAWIADMLDRHIDREDLISSVKAIWKEWEEANNHFPHHLRAGIVKNIDGTLSARGFFSLRELLDLI